MAQFVNFTDIDGLVTRINPDDVVSLYIKPSDPTIAVIRLNDNSTFLSTLSLAALQALFSPSEIIALDAPTLAALESITVQNPGGVSAVNIQDGGNSITVDGTVGITGTVTVTGALTDTQLRAIPVPISGTVTVTDGSGPLTVDGTVTANQGTSPWVVSGTVTSNQGTSPWVTSLDATTLAALESITVQNPGGASAVNIQDGGNSITVDGTVAISGTVAVTQSTSPWVVSGTITDSTAKAEDAPAVTADLGIPILAVRNDTAASKTSNDGDYSMLATDAAGRLGIADLGGSITVDGTVAVTQSTSPWVTSLDATSLAALESITVQNPGGASAVNIQDGGNSITVDGTVSISGTVTVDTELPAASALADADANPTTSRVGANNLVYNGTTWDRVRAGTATGSLLVNNPTAANLLATVTIDAASLAALESITVQNPAGASAVNIQDGGNSITVDGSVSITGSVSVTGPLTDTQLRASAVPVSGPLTDTQLRATPVPVSGTVAVTQSTSPWVISGTVVTDTELPAASALADADANPTTSRIGSNTLVFNGTTWDRSRSGTALGSLLVNNPTAANLLVTATLDAASLAALESITVQNPSGASAVNIQDGGNSITVDGSVSITGSVAVTGPLTDTQLRASAVPVSGAFFQATQPVSGPLTDTQLRATPVPVSGTVAATQSGSWSVTNLNGAGAAAVNIQDGGNSITVDGTVSISGSVAVTGPLTDAQLRATPVPVTGTQQLGTITNGAETAVSSTAVQILASNASRKKYLIQNTGTANIRVGTTGVTATTGARIVPNGSLLFEMPNCPTQTIFAIREGSVDSIAFAEEIT